jgi:hypothetical protein
VLWSRGTRRRVRLAPSAEYGLRDVIGVLLWLGNSYIPMDGKIKKIMNVVVVICVVV